MIMVTVMVTKEQYKNMANGYHINNKFQQNTKLCSLLQLQQFQPYVSCQCEINQMKNILMGMDMDTIENQRIFLIQSDLLYSILLLEMTKNKYNNCQMPKLQKTLLKEKLLNYQKEIQNQRNPQVELQNIHSQKSDENYFSLKQLNEISHSSNNKAAQQDGNQDYLRYLSQFTFKGENSCYKSDLTRQNIQTMNKKTRLIRSSYYQGPLNFQLAIKISNSPYKELIHKQLTFRNRNTISYDNREKKSIKLYKSSEICQNNSPFLTIRPKCQTRENSYQQIKRSDSFVMPSKKPSKQMKRAKTAHQTRKQQKISLKTVNKQFNSIQKCENSSTDMGLIINQFKPKLKSKYLEDNIKVMANIMKRRIGVMNGDQIYKYVNKISNKRQPIRYLDERLFQKRSNQIFKK